MFTSKKVTLALLIFKKTSSEILFGDEEKMNDISVRLFGKNEVLTIEIERYAPSFGKMKVHEVRKFIAEKKQHLKEDSFTLISPFDFTDREERILDDPNEVLDLTKLDEIYVCQQDMYSRILYQEGILKIGDSRKSIDDQEEKRFKHHYFENPLPLPKDEEEVERRKAEYEKLKKKRKSLFLKRTIEGYLEARRMYYYALCQIAFVRDHSFLEIQSNYNNIFNQEQYDMWVKRVLIVMRKISECCYSLGKLDEAMELSEKIIRIVESRGGRILERFLKLTYVVMVKVLIAQNNLKKAKKELKIGSTIDPQSLIIKRTQEYYTYAKKKKETVIGGFNIHIHDERLGKGGERTSHRVIRFLFLSKLLRERSLYYNSPEKVRLIKGDLNSRCEYLKNEFIGDHQCEENKSEVGCLRLKVNAKSNKSNDFFVLKVLLVS